MYKHAQFCVNMLRVQSVYPDTPNMRHSITHMCSSQPFSSTDMCNHVFTCSMYNCAKTCIRVCLYMSPMRNCCSINSLSSAHSLLHTTHVHAYLHSISMHTARLAASCLCMSLNSKFKQILLYGGIHLHRVKYPISPACLL
jgi:hypothetical protein